MDTDGVGEGEVDHFRFAVGNEVVVEVDIYGAVDAVDGFYDADVAVEDVLIVVVASLNDFVIRLKLKGAEGHGFSV